MLVVFEHNLFCKALYFSCTTSWCLAWRTHNLLWHEAIKQKVFHSWQLYNILQPRRKNIYQTLMKRMYYLVEKMNYIVFSYPNFRNIFRDGFESPTMIYSLAVLETLMQAHENQKTSQHTLFQSFDQLRASLTFCAQMKSSIAVAVLRKRAHIEMHARKATPFSVLKQRHAQCNTCLFYV